MGTCTSTRPKTRAGEAGERGFVSGKALGQERGCKREVKGGEVARGEAEGEDR